MIQVIPILISIMTAQGNAVLYGPVPENAATFKLRFQNDENEYVGGIRRGTDWVSDPQDLEKGLRRIEVVFDTPWNPQPPFSTVWSRVREYAYEPPALRRKRLEQGWDAAGYVFIDTPEGRRPILRQEMELARRARDMAAAIESRLQPQPVEITPNKTPEKSGGTAVNPRWMRQWGGHITMALIGIALAALILKKTVFA